MKEQYTKGLWKVETEYMSEEGYGQYIKRQEIIKHDKDVTYVIVRINWCNPVEANSNLLAAAPEMYEALQRVLLFITNGRENGYIQMPEVGDSALETPNIIRKALAKAQGLEDKA